jgi:pyruvate kinase
VECGYERVAEFQKEVLSLAQAAHFPVIWATQVLDGLFKTGRPCRAEVTDAGTGERAECVMLNKGSHHIVEAIPDVGLHPATRSGPVTALVIL